MFFARSEGYRHGPEATHNPKVVGSNPTPATNVSPQDHADLGGFVFLSTPPYRGRFSDNSPRTIRAHAGEEQSAGLELGGPDAPGIWHRRASVCPLWRPAAPDRHAARSRGHPEDPRGPGPRALGAESRARPSRVWRRRVLIRIGCGARRLPLCLRRGTHSW
jgi:hypothetical protein